jgi:TolB-like protein
VSTALRTKGLALPLLCSVLTLQASALHAQATEVASAPAVASSPAPAAPVATQRWLVQRIEAVGADPKLARSLEEAVVLDIGQREGIAVVSPAEMEQTVEAAATQAELGCDELEQCMVEVKRKLRVQNIVTGKLSKLGDDYILALGTVDLAANAVGRRVARQGKSAAELLKQVHDAVDELLGKSKPRQAFKLENGAELKLAVMPLAARGVAAPTADAMTQILSAELNGIEGISVISRDDIQAMLAKVQTESELGCTDNMECIVEIGAALGLAKLVTGTVGKVKDTFVVSMQLVDIRKAEVENRVLESFEGDADELKNAVKLGAYQIAGVDYLSRMGQVAFTFNVSEADARMSGKAYPLRSNQLEASNLRPGRYSLRVIADQDDYYPLRTDVYVAPGANNVRSFDIRERETPWYGQWWVWTIAGVVVAGSVATALLLTQDEPSSQSGTATLP